MGRYFLNILCWIDCGINTLFAGDYKETCSSRLGRHYNDVWIARKIADIINWIALHVFGQANHCKVEVQPDCDHEEEILK